MKYWSPVNTPVFAADGRIVAIIHHVEDVTEFMLLREQQATRQDTATEKLDRMEAEILHRSRELTESNRQLKTAKAELAQLNEQLRELDRLKSEFFSNISHEFSTPLNGVLGMADLLQYTMLDDTQRSFVKTIRNSGKTLMPVIDDILDFSKVEAGKITR